MNTFKGHIVDILTSNQLSIVSVAIHEQIVVKAIVIETPKTAAYLQMGQQISILFKETEVAIGVGMEHAISLQNKIPANILHIEKGKLLSKLSLASVVGEITAIISTRAVIQLALKEQMQVMAMIKLNEVMLSEL